MEATLKELCAKYYKNGWPDKDTVHSYIDVYEKILSPYRHTAKNILEIGLMSGESLRMWEEYFDGKVYGIDCSETPIDGLADLRPMIAEGGHNIVIADATNEEEIEKHFGNIKWDIVIDDGSHLIEHQMQTFEIFKKRMNKDGVIILEDIQDLDNSLYLFRSLDGMFDAAIEDRRHINRRYDDVLIIIKNLQND